MELVVVGSEDFVLGFRLVGIRKTTIARPEEMEAKVSEALGDPDAGVLVLHSDDVAKLPAGLRRRLTASSKPVVITVGRKEEEDLRMKVRRAIGIDLYKTG